MTPSNKPDFQGHCNLLDQMNNALDRNKGQTALWARGHIKSHYLAVHSLVKSLIKDFSQHPNVNDLLPLKMTMDLQVKRLEPKFATTEDLSREISVVTARVRLFTKPPSHLSAEYHAEVKRLNASLVGLTNDVVCRQAISVLEEKLNKIFDDFKSKMAGKPPRHQLIGYQLLRNMLDACTEAFEKLDLSQINGLAFVVPPAVVVTSEDRKVFEYYNPILCGQILSITDDLVPKIKALSSDHEKQQAGLRNRDKIKSLVNQLNALIAPLVVTCDASRKQAAARPASKPAAPPVMPPVPPPQPQEALVDKVTDNFKAIMQLKRLEQEGKYIDIFTDLRWAPASSLKSYQLIYIIEKLSLTPVERETEAFKKLDSALEPNVRQLLSKVGQDPAKAAKQQEVEQQMTRVMDRVAIIENDLYCKKALPTFTVSVHRVTEIIDRWLKFYEHRIRLWEMPAAAGANEHERKSDGALLLPSSDVPNLKSLIDEMGLLFLSAEGNLDKEVHFPLFLYKMREFLRICKEDLDQFYHHLQ